MIEHRGNRVQEVEVPDTVEVLVEVPDTVEVLVEVPDTVEVLGLTEVQTVTDV